MSPLASPDGVVAADSGEQPQDGAVETGTITPTWIGPESAPIASWLHHPVGSLRGGVVVVPPVGVEQVSAHFALYELAESLAATGLAVLRYDPPGTGDSAEPANGLLDEWIGAVNVAVSYLRTAGCPTITVIGMRMGATVAAAAVAGMGQLPPLACERLVLWDPCLSAKSYLREQAALHRVTLGPATVEGGAEIPGAVFSPEQLSDLRRLDLGALPPGQLAAAASTVVLVRQEQGDSAAIARLAALPGVEVAVAHGQPELLDVRSYSAVLPSRSIRAVVDLCRPVPVEPPAPSAQLAAPVRRRAVVAHTADGRPIVETFIHFADRDLFGIRCEVEADDPRPATGAGKPAVVFLNVATDHHIGPARSWVSLSRRAAEMGMTAIRFDRSGVGESRAGRAAERTIYSARSVLDTVDVLRTVRADSSAVAVVGLCSGTWVAAKAAAEVAIDVVYLINGGTWTNKPPRGGPPPPPALSEPGAPPSRPTAREVLKRRLPLPLWLGLGRLGLANDPASMLARLLRAGTAVRLIFAPPEYASFQEQRGDAALPRLARRFAARLQVREISPADHALLYRPGREQAYALLESWLVEDLAADSPSR